MAKQQVLLKDLLREKHWQTYRTFCNRQYDRAAKKVDPTLVGTYPSRAQLHRWQSGELKGLPYPHHCQVLEAMFPGISATQMFELITERQRTADVSDGSLALDELLVSIEASPDSPASPPQGDSLNIEQPSYTHSLLAQVPQSFSARQLRGFWLTCFQFTPESIPDVKHELGTETRELKHHADIVQLMPKSDRLITARNYPPEPRTEGRTVSFHNDIEAELVGRHLIGHWKNTNDTRYFGSLQLAVLPGETVIEGYYTSFLNDIQVDTGHWKWVRLDEATLDATRLFQVNLREPTSLHKLVDQHSWYDPPLVATDIEEEIT